MLRLVFYFAAAAGAFGASAADAPTEATASPTWALRLPSVEKVVFRGSVNYDSAGLGTGSFLYPAPGAVGLLAAVLTHGLITSGARQQQRDQIQRDADQVFAPYEPVLAGFTNRQLIEASLRKLPVGANMRLLAAAESAGSEALIETAPVFSLTQDQRALVLDNVVRIFAAGDAKPIYAQTIRVVSLPLTVSPTPPTEPVTPPSASDESALPTALWLDAQGRRLTDQSAALFAESLDIALADSNAALGDPAAPHKTFRYAEGGRERMERAQFVSERCAHTVIRTLRGWLMVIPAARAGIDNAVLCAASAG